MVLMQNIPDDYDTEELKTDLFQAVPEILDIHEVSTETFFDSNQKTHNI